MKFITQSVILISSFLAVFILNQTEFGKYSIPLIGVLVFIYILLSSRRKKLPNFLNESPFTIFALNSVVLLLIAQTGSLHSPIFFLLYFILFGIAFVFEANLTFVFAIGAGIYFFPEAVKNDVFMNFVKLGSLLLLSPLAYFVGNQNRRSAKTDENVEALKERSKDSADTISKDVEALLKDQKENLSSQDVDKLNDVLEETESLREEKNK
ncbi:MAG: hypothetical protein HYT09_03575 [Candidatus Levybacteria bacterium]|nr:hypothetical protein [Candidatus Levybacteria bacterium]